MFNTSSTLSVPLVGDQTRDGIGPSPFYVCLVIKCVDGTVHMQGIFSPDANPTHLSKSAEPPYLTFSNSVDRLIIISLAPNERCRPVIPRRHHRQMRPLQATLPFSAAGHGRAAARG
jgi:hypothetical protein